MEWSLISVIITAIFFSSGSVQLIILYLFYVLVNILQSFE